MTAPPTAVDTIALRGPDPSVITVIAVVRATEVAKAVYAACLLVERARRVLMALMLAIGAVWIGMNVLVGAYTGVYRAAWMLATGDISAITFGERRAPDDQLQTTPPWDSPPPLPMITPPPRRVKRKLGRPSSRQRC